MIDVHPGVFGLSDNRPVAAPRIAVQLFKSGNNLGSHRVQVNVPNQGKKIVVLIAENGFITVLEKVAGPLVASVEILGVPRKKFPHDRGNAVFPALEENMDMVVHEDPCVYGAFAIAHCLAEALQKSGLVLVVFKDCGLVDTPDHDVVKGTGDI